MGIVEPIAKHTFRSTARVGAPQDDAAEADTIGVRALLLARAVTLPAGIYLGLTSADVDTTAAGINSILAVLWILGTGVVITRRGLSTRLGLAILVVDTAIALTGIVSTGGESSDMCILLGVLPLAIAFVFPPALVIAATVAGVITLLALAGSDVDALAPVLVVLVWAGAPVRRSPTTAGACGGASRTRRNCAHACSRHRRAPPHASACARPRSCRPGRSSTSGACARTPRPASTRRRWRTAAARPAEPCAGS